MALVSLASCGGGGGGPGGSGGVGGGNGHPRTITGIRGSGPRFSPDGTLLAYARDTGTTTFELAVMTAAGADSRSLASDGNRLLGMVWTADGSELIYGSADTGMRTAQLTGGPSQFLFDTPDALNPDLSPDGRWLAYGVYDGHLQLADLSQSPPVLSDLGFFVDTPRFSPDGATLALNTGLKIQLLDLASRTLTDVIDVEYPLGRVDWFPDGTRLLAGTERGIEIITLGPPIQRQTIEAGGGGSYLQVRDVDLSPDATSVAFAREGSELLLLTGF